MSPLVGLDLDAASLDLRGASGLLDLTDRTGGAFAPVPDRPARRDRATSSPTPAVHAAATPVPDGDPDPLVARWLTAAERQATERRGERGRAAHVAGRVAAKQAIQAHLTSLGFAELDPQRIEIGNDDRGCPVVAVRGARVATRHLRVTIAHGGTVAVAAAAQLPPDRAAGPDRGPGIGIDVEPVEPRSSRFERLTLGAAEQSLARVPGDDRDTWLTRLWAAKEAAAKATGRGLEGRPKAFAATEVDGERLLVADRWITTEVVRFAGIDHVVALTGATRTECTWHRS